MKGFTQWDLPAHAVHTRLCVNKPQPGHWPTFSIFIGILTGGHVPSITTPVFHGFRPMEGGGGSRAIPGYSAHQVYYQSPERVGPVCDHLLTRAQGHSALELPLITSYFGHSGAVVYGVTTSEWVKN